MVSIYRDIFLTFYDVHDCISCLYMDGISHCVARYFDVKESTPVNTSEYSVLGCIKLSTAYNGMTAATKDKERINDILTQTTFCFLFQSLMCHAL